MNDEDLSGSRPLARPSRVTIVRDQRPNVAQRKAELCLILLRMCQRPPQSVTQGSIQTVRHWRTEQERAVKIMKSKRASVVELELAIKSMKSFGDPA